MEQASSDLLILEEALESFREQLLEPASTDETSQNDTTHMTLTQPQSSQTNAALETTTLLTTNLSTTAAEVASDTACSETVIPLWGHNIQLIVTVPPIAAATSPTRASCDANADDAGDYCDYNSDCSSDQFSISEAIAIAHDDNNSNNNNNNNNSNSNINQDEHDIGTMKSPPSSTTSTSIKAVTIRRHSKQLPRLLLQASHSNSSIQHCDEKDPTTNNQSSSLDTCDQHNECWTYMGATTPTSLSLSFSSSSSSSPGICTILPDDLIAKVTSFLDVTSLLHVRQCSRSLRDLASRNEAGWENLCWNLWSNKVHVSSQFVLSNNKSTIQDPTKNASDVDTDVDTDMTLQEGNTFANDADDASCSRHYMHAYRESIREATERQHVTMEELCYDPVTHTGTVWSFRFKESAGADWTTSDPWYSGFPCRKMVFPQDGSVRQYVPAPDAPNTRDGNGMSTNNGGANNNNNNMTGSSNSNGRHRSSMSSSTTAAAAETSDSESSLPELISPNFGNLLIEARQQHARTNHNADNHDLQNHHHQQNHPHVGHLVHPPLSMSWRFLTRPMDMPVRPLGSYLRFSVGGREVPTYSVRRSPTGNWGFVMESCWGLYASFELPPKRSFQQQQEQQQQLQQEQRQSNHQPLQQRRRLRRTEAGARWVDVLDNGEETLSLNQHSTQRQRRRSSASSRSSFRRRQEQYSLQEEAELDDAALMDDAALEITNEIQWREAFLYNVGARVLPEGDDAADEFDRAFRGVP